MYPSVVVVTTHQDSNVKSGIPFHHSSSNGAKAYCVSALNLTAKQQLYKVNLVGWLSWA